MATTNPRMGAFDTVMWCVEGDPILRSVMTLVVLLDGTPDRRIVQDRVEHMSLANPKLRQRAIGNSLSLVPARWETDPNFELRYHLRWVRVPGSNAGMPEVLDLAEAISERDFDRSRPLWEAHIVTGLASGESVLLLKVHHAITDGVGGMRLATVLFDLARDAKPDLGAPPAAPSGEVLDAAERIEEGLSIGVQEVFDDLRSTTKGALRYFRKAAADPVTTAVSTQEWVASAGRMMAPAAEPMSSIWTERSLSVAFSIIEAPLPDLKAAAKFVGGTLNDAFMAAVTGGLYKYHEAHGSDPDALRVNMPINLRSAGDSDAGGNKWVPARFLVPTNLTDPAARMRQLHPILEQARLEPALGLSDVVYKLLTVLPRPVTTNISGSLMKGTDFAATNVAGPSIPVYFAKTKILALVPFAPKGGAAVNVGLMSYNGTVFLGVNIDRGAVENPAELTNCLNESLREVLAVGQPRAPHT